MAKRVAAAALAAAALAPAPAALAHGAHHAHEPAAPVKPSRHRWGANYFPNVELITHEGKKVRFYDDLLKGKSVAINAIYTECDQVCPLETANMAQLQRVLGERLGRDIVMYSISIDPAHDTPEVLRQYAQRFGAGPGWFFLTGKLEDVRLVVRKLGLMSARDFANPGRHHAAVLLVGNEPTGVWTRNSAVDRPDFLAARIGTFLGWRDEQPARSYAHATPVSVSIGQRLFVSRCSACHTLGEGEKLGPDLQAVTARRSRAWLERYIFDPDVVRASGDPVATALHAKYKTIRMPNLRLGASDVVEIVSYLEEVARQPISRSE